MDRNNFFPGDADKLIAVAPHPGCVDRNMTVVYAIQAWGMVAPHPGCVDRNVYDYQLKGFFKGVAPHPGCVDRNSSTKRLEITISCRTPPGVRG